MIPVRKVLRLCKVSIRMPFVEAHTMKKERIAQIILHPFRHWESQSTWHWMGPQPGYRSWLGKSYPILIFVFLEYFLRRKSFCSFLLSNKKDAHVRTCYCTFRWRQGYRIGITTDTKGKPIGSFSDLTGSVCPAAKGCVQHSSEGQATCVASPYFVKVWYANLFFLQLLKESCYLAKKCLQEN